MTDDRGLVVWTIYDHPSDFPHGYVARKFLIVRGKPEPVPTLALIQSHSLEAVRVGLLEECPGLVCIKRNEGDEPQIVETWL